VPFQRTVVGGIERKCAEKINDACKLFNTKLSKELASLNRNLPNTRMVYLDVYNPLLDIILNYKNYGMYNSTLLFISNLFLDLILILQIHSWIENLYHIIHINFFTNIKLFHNIANISILMSLITYQMIIELYKILHEISI